MPHDANGNKLVVGDKVMIPATIVAIYPTDDYCNCTVELDQLMPPDSTKTTLTSNTKQVLKVQPPVQAADDPEGPPGGPVDGL